MLTTKKCFKCNKTTPITNFYKHKQMLDGRLGKCKQCTKKDVNEHRTNNIDKVREYDRNRGYRGTRGKIYNQSKDKAKGSCFFCGSKERIEKHHPDYTKPRFVVVLCRSCHRDTHSIIKLDGDAIKDISHFKIKDI